jgi:hypothetical protein
LTALADSSASTSAATTIITLVFIDSVFVTLRDLLTGSGIAYHW